MMKDVVEKTIEIAVIMAGGAGERFWPLSRETHPKQLLELGTKGKSLLAEAVERLQPMFSPGRIFIATSRQLQEKIQGAGLNIPAANVIGEPCKRNTAGCLAYAAAVICARLDTAPDNILMAVLTADQKITPTAKFQTTLRLALDAAAGNPALVTIGIQPARAETGYGYIQAGTESAADVFEVSSFHEKPDPETAREFIDAGNFYWNSGMFFWRISTFLDELAKVNPELRNCIQNMMKAMEKDDQAAADKSFNSLKSEPIDCALLERSDRVMVVRAGFDWDDIGAWDALDRTLPKDSDNNVLIGDPVVIDSHDCIVYNVSGAEKTAVSVIGASGLAVIVAPDAVLVVPKARAQDVKAAVNELKKRSSGQV